MSSPLKVLVIGSGGREHALCWKIAASPLVGEVLCAPGNAGTQSVARSVDVPATDLDGLARLCAGEKPGLVVVGPEDPLSLGLADRLRAAGTLVFGPGRAGARLEGSKVFAKEFLDRHRIPTGAWRRFERSGAAKSYLESQSLWPLVIKADGLCAGKGVFVVDDAREGCSVVDALMEEKRLGEAGREIVIEEFISGRELSVQLLTDGATLCLLEPVMDYKQVSDGDSGPNTGGMGIVSPVSFVTQRLMRQIELRVLVPALHGLRVEGIAYRGVLYVGLMITEAGPRVLEFNCRFGDPETQAIVRRMRSDLVPYLLAVARGELEKEQPPEWDERTCVGVVAAAQGYPGDYEKGHVIQGLAEAGLVADALVFQAGTKSDRGQVLTNGGRVLCVTALGLDVHVARESAYRALDLVHWSGKFARRDIGLPRSARPSGTDTQAGLESFGVFTSGQSSR
ncbi:MAG: phosphoribosylamine--glycine ligase, partial [Planctomycetes bacterium]|nr:phosphoribosylamine--glycine ligase [Planctomycetota bacterium]